MNFALFVVFLGNVLFLQVCVEDSDILPGEIL